RHAERLFHYLIRHVQNETDAAELAQESFVKVFKNCGRYNPSQKFSTWLYTIGTNLARDRIKWRSRRPEISIDAPIAETDHDLGSTLPDSGRSPDADLLATERADAVQRAIAGLPDELREPLVLAEYERMPAADIGKILGCTPKAVESRLYRARQQLRTTLTRWLATA